MTTDNLILKILGSYLFLAAVLMLLKPNLILNLMDKINNNILYKKIIGVFALVLGILIFVFKDRTPLTSFNLVWAFGVLAMIKGIIFLTKPQVLFNIASKVYKSDVHIRFIGLLILLISFYIFL